MADVELVIKIPEEDYEYCKTWELMSPIAKSIVNGTPLPKGHGRLIDADEFQKYCFNKLFDKRLTEAGLTIINMFLGVQSTIIEADKTESEVQE